MTKIQDRLQIIGTKLEQATIEYSREKESVQLLAVSKRHPVKAIQEAYDFGQKIFGENYIQELIEKSVLLSELEIEWHFIGPIQSNKTKSIASVASWVHTVDRLKVAKRLNDHRPENSSPLSVCIQVNISGEESKSGVKEDELKELAMEVSKLPNLKLRGLMTIPAPESDYDKQRDVFAKLARLKDGLNQQGLKLDTLSMGMSGDMKAAIAEGATIVRIGTAIFGTRKS